MMLFALETWAAVLTRAHTGSSAPGSSQVCTNFEHLPLGKPAGKELRNNELLSAQPPREEKSGM